jgi:hypothetical protein
MRTTVCHMTVGCYITASRRVFVAVVVFSMARRQLTTSLPYQGRAALCSSPRRTWSSEAVSDRVDIGSESHEECTPIVQSSTSDTVLLCRCRPAMPSRREICRSNRNGNAGRHYNVCARRRCGFFKWTTAISRQSGVVPSEENKCYCMKGTRVMVALTNRTGHAGERFLTCWDGHCSFFQWM